MGNPLPPSPALSALGCPYVGLRVMYYEQACLEMKRRCFTKAKFDPGHITQPGRQCRIRVEQANLR